MPILRADVTSRPHQQASGAAQDVPLRLAAEQPHQIPPSTTADTSRRGGVARVKEVNALVKTSPEPARRHYSSVTRAVAATGVSSAVRLLSVEAAPARRYDNGQRLWGWLIGDEWR